MGAARRVPSLPEPAMRCSSLLSSTVDRATTTVGWWRGRPPRHHHPRARWNATVPGCWQATRRPGALSADAPAGLSAMGEDEGADVRRATRGIELVGLIRAEDRYWPFGRPETSVRSLRNNALRRGAHWFARLWPRSPLVPRHRTR